MSIIAVCTVNLSATHATDTTDDFITISEIYDNPTNVQALYNALAGDGATYEQIKTLAGTPKNAADFRTLNGGRDVKVVFGGYAWHVCYLSQTKEDNPRPILTLYMTEAIGESQWNTYLTGADGYTVPYPAKMYSTSYIRTVALNNGGSYASSGTQLVAYPARADVALARFTVDDVDNSVTQLLVKPELVAWQERQYSHYLDTGYVEETTGQVTATTLGDTTNDGYWGDGDYTWHKYNSLVAAKPQYGAWAGDYLWLPSMTEVVQSGIWQLSRRQAITANASTNWLRSGDDNGDNSGGNYFAMFISNQQENHVNNGTNGQCSNSLGVRPALHLDLSAPELCVHEYGAWEYVSTDADGMIHQQRVCQKCGRVGEQRTVYPTLHHITIIGDVSGNREQLTINFYSTRTEVIPDLLAFIQLLNDASSGVFVVVDGSNVRYNEPGQGRREYPVTAVVPSSTANTFGYCYLNDKGNTVTVWRNLTEIIEITDSEMANPDA